MPSYACPRCSNVVTTQDTTALRCPRCGYPESTASGWAPQARPLTSQEERQFAMWLHLSAFSTVIVPAGWLLGPLIMWLIKKEQSAFVDRAGRRAVNFQLTVMVVAFAAGMLVLVVAIATLGIGLLFLIPALFFGAIALLVLEIVAIIQAATKSNRGEEATYPFSFPFIKA